MSSETFEKEDLLGDGNMVDDLNLSLTSRIVSKRLTSMKKKMSFQTSK